MPPSVASYFALARTGGEGANPYYPRGSDLSAACFFQQKTLEEYIEFLSFCDSPSLHDPGFLPWILSLPPLLRIIEEKAGFESLFQEYRQEALTRFACVDAAMEEITGVLKDNGLYQDVFLCFAPNLLQSPYLVDYALADNTLYIIGAVFSRTAVLHEYLHLLLHDRKAFFLQMAGEKGAFPFCRRRAFAAAGLSAGRFPVQPGARPGGLLYPQPLGGARRGKERRRLRPDSEGAGVRHPAGTHGAAAQPAPGRTRAGRVPPTVRTALSRLTAAKRDGKPAARPDKISLAFAGFPREGQFFMVLK